MASKKTKKIMGTSIALAAIGIGAIYQINPWRKPVIESSPFFHDNQVYFLRNNRISDEEGSLKIPVRAVDFAIKDKDFYFLEYDYDRNKFKKFDSNLEEIVDIENGDHIFNIDLQNDALIKKVFHENKGEIAYYKDNKKLSGLHGESPVFYNEGVYSLKNGDIFFQNIKDHSENQISLSEEKRITNLGDYNEFRILNDMIYSLNGSKNSLDVYLSSLNSPEKHKRITYDRLKPLSPKKDKKDLIAYQIEGKDYVAFSRGDRKIISKIDKIPLGGKNED